MLQPAIGRPPTRQRDGASPDNWTESDLRFWDYHDKDGQEVDVVITREQQTRGIEVQASSSLSRKDGLGLERLAGHCGEHFQQGFLLSIYLFPGSELAI